jgi:hypothetical protein
VGAATRHSLITSPDLQGQERGERDEFDDDATAADLLDMMEQGETGDPPPEGFSEDGDDAIGVDGKLVSTEIDLFHSSRSMWMQTTAGVWFLPAGQRYIAVVRNPEPGLWDVVAMNSTTFGDSRFVVRGIHQVDYAMGFAEADVTPTEKSSSTRAAPWRARKATQISRDAVTRVGIIPPAKATEGELMDLLVPVYASARIDPYLPEYAR